MNKISIKAVIRQNVGTILLLLLFSLSLSLNVIFGLHLKELLTPKILGVRPSTRLQAIPVLDQNGAHGQVEFGTIEPTVLYVISPQCPWCKRNEANMIELARTKAHTYRFIGLSISKDHLREYWTSSHLPFPTYLIESSEYIKTSGLGDLTPQTIVVAPTGKVDKVWLGAYNEQRKNQVESYFGVKLPGLLPAYEKE